MNNHWAGNDFLIVGAINESVMWSSVRSVRVVMMTLVVVSLPAGNTLAQSSASELENGFLFPPNSAKPRVWWHWMNGNIKKEGIALDLAWMHRIGIGGVQTFDAAYDTP